MKMNTTPVRFIHVLLAGGTMVAMAMIAEMTGHTTVIGAVQDVLAVIGTLILTVMYANFKEKKS